MVAVASAVPVRPGLSRPRRVGPVGDWRSASRAPVGLAPDPRRRRSPSFRSMPRAPCAGAATSACTRGLPSSRATPRSSRSTRSTVGGCVARAAPSASIIARPTRAGSAIGRSLLADRRGEGVDELITRIEAAVDSYPYADTYRVWPGPNSNTFVAHVLRSAPELRADLPATAIGKDYLGPGVRRAVAERHRRTAQRIRRGRRAGRRRRGRRAQRARVHVRHRSARSVVEAAVGGPARLAAFRCTPPSARAGRELACDALVTASLRARVARARSRSTRTAEPRQFTFSWQFERRRRVAAARRHDAGRAADARDRAERRMARRPGAGLERSSSAIAARSSRWPAATARASIFSRPSVSRRDSRRRGPINRGAPSIFTSSRTAARSSACST